MASDPYLPLYEKLNWDAPTGPIRCNVCVDGARNPQAGAYPSALWHYEKILGPLEGERSGARILFVFQDPRPSERHFVAVPPERSPGEFAANEHRYFCLTTAAWRVLRLDKATASPQPIWPTDGTAHHYLKRYLAASGAWSYDGFLAYFIWLLRPADALVTNLAKCHFGSAQSRSVYRRCASVQMTREVDLLAPNLLVSFTSQFDDSLMRRNVAPLLGVPHIRLFHPAATYRNREARRARFMNEVTVRRSELAEVRVDVDRVLLRWQRDVANSR